MKYIISISILFFIGCGTYTKVDECFDVSSQNQELLIQNFNRCLSDNSFIDPHNACLYYANKMFAEQGWRLANYYTWQDRPRISGPCVMERDITKKDFIEFQEKVKVLDGM